MKHMFSAAGLRALRELCQSPTLFAFDYDGTLAKIVDDPESARLSAATQLLFDALVERAPTAVVSGRSLNDLRHRLPTPPRYLVGNHGLEGLPMRRGALHLAKLACRGWLAPIDAVLKEAGGSRTFVEDKEYSLAIHLRSRRLADEKRSIVSAVRALHPAARVIAGKRILNLIPSGVPHKGSALAELLNVSGRTWALYVGDDDTDEDVFSLANPQMVTVRVGYRKNSSAQFYLRRQTEVDRLLRLLNANLADRLANR